MFPNEKVNYQNSIRDEAEGMNSGLQAIVS